MIAVLLVSVVVTSVFSMVLTARTGVNKSGKKGQAVFYLREVVEALKTYVTADLTAPGPNSWQLPGDTCGCWALQAGAHNATGYLPTSFTGAPTSGQLTYDVIDMACGAATCKQVTFNLTWNE